MAENPVVVAPADRNTAPEVEQKKVLLGRAGSLSNPDLQMLRGILRDRAAALSAAQRRIIVLALDPGEPITRSTIARLCEFLCISTDSTRIAWVVKGFAAKKVCRPAGALKLLQPRFSKRSRPAAESVIDELCIARIKIRDPDLVAVCDELGTVPHTVDEGTVDRMIEAMRGKKNIPLVTRRVSEALGLQLTSLQMLEVRVEARRRRRESYDYNELTDAVLDKLSMTLAGKKPSQPNVVAAAEKAGLRVPQRELRRAAKILREHLVTPYSLQLTGQTRRLLEAMSQRLTGLDRHLIIDRALLLAMESMFSNGQAGFSEGYDHPMSRRLIEMRFRMLLPSAPRPDVWVRAKKKHQSQK